MPSISTSARAVDLFWSDDGQIACRRHMPYPGSDTFVYGGWRPIESEGAEEFTREVGRAPSCETCMAIERREEEEAGRG